MRAKNEHRQYWDWYRNRNVARWQTQIAGVMDYDVKNMMHTFRLLYSGLNIMENGEPIVRFEGEKLAHLMAIRSGAFEYRELLDEAHAMMEKLELLRHRSSLRQEADLDDVDRLLLEITNLWEKDHAR